VDWTPDGRLVFDVLENDRLSIWISNADGSNAIQLTPQESDNSDPKVSGDGRYIVFTSKRAGYNQIWRMNIDGSSAALLADVPGITQEPRFTPDGQNVVFRWYNEGSAPMAQVSIEGGTVKPLDYLPNAYTYYWDMSRDGRYVAYTKGGSSDPMKVVVAAADSLAPVATLDIRPTWVFKWSPDSKRIFYQESQRGESLSTKIFEIDPFRGEPKLWMTPEPDNIIDLTFSRDGSRFAAVRFKVLTNALLLTGNSSTRSQ
jgi:Tol biopolymer transport system component